VNLFLPSFLGGFVGNLLLMGALRMGRVTGYLFVGLVIRIDEM
jgi:hypothetical protein